MMGVFRRQWRVSAGALVALVAAVACLFWTLPAASADPALSSLVLTSTFPGLEMAPPGTGNGPLTAGDLDLLGVNPSAATAGAELNEGMFSGYLRTWSKPSNGDIVAIGALRFTNAAAAMGFLAGANHAIATQPGLTMDGSEGIPGAAVYTIGSLANGATQLVNFDRGNDVFVLAVRSPSVDLTLADAAILANRQAAWSSGNPVASSSGSSWAYGVGEIFGALAAATLLTWLLSHWMAPHYRDGQQARRARRRRRSGRGADVYPPPPRAGKDAAWLPNPLHMNEQLFWNGHEWAGRRQWMTGSGWVEQTPAHVG